MFSFHITGSGSSYLYGFFDQAWREGMSHEEAEVCCIRSLKFLICIIWVTIMNRFLKQSLNCFCQVGVIV